MILDTNALSAFADGASDLRAAILGEDELAIPSVVLGEYLFVIKQSRHQSRYERWLRDSLELFSILQVGSKTAAWYAEIRLQLNQYL